MRRIKDLGIVFCIIVGVFACAIVVPCSCEGVRETSWHTQFRLNLMQIALAMHNYYSDHGELPPAIVRDKRGQPLYSWRVLLLPYLDHEPLYKEFKLDEPWDSPHNKKLATETPIPFNIGDDGPGLTCFQVLVGPGTAFERPGLKLKDDFPDGTSNTIFVVEAKVAVPWSKPVDLAYDPNGPLPEFGGRLTIPTSRFLHCRFGHRPCFTACLADGRPLSIANDTDEKVIRALITRNGGEKKGRDDLN